MIQFQENTQADVRQQGWTDLMSWDPSSYRQGSSKSNYNKLAFKSQKYKVECWSDQQLLHHSHHAESQLNP